MMLRRIIYRSRIAADVDGNQIREISTQSQSVNATRNIQGALIAINRYFYQVLEGEGSALEPLLVKIQSDPRHYDFMILQDIPVTSRKFEGWDMTLVTSPSPDLETCVAQINLAFDNQDTSEVTHQRLCEGLVYIILGAVEANTLSV